MSDNPAGGPSGGLLDHLQELFASGLEYFQARLSLVGLEAKEALLHFAIIIGLLGMAISVIIFGYLFLCIALTVLIAELFHVSAGWVILVLALLHFAVAAGAALLAIMRLKAGVFSATLAEFKKDQQWLNQTSK